MSDQIIEVDLKRSEIIEINNNMQDLFYTTRPDYEECLLRCKILNLMNNIWQEYLIENEKDAMYDKLNKKYCDIITSSTFIQIVTINDNNDNNNDNDNEEELKPYKKYPEDELTPLASIKFNNTQNEKEKGKEEEEEEKLKNSHKNKNESFNHWLTPIQGKSKKIIIYKYKDGPIIKEIEIPAVMIFGSIAFGLDGYGSDIDLALPASISSLVKKIFYPCTQ